MFHPGTDSSDGGLFEGTQRGAAIHTAGRGGHVSLIIKPSSLRLSSELRVAV